MDVAYLNGEGSNGGGEGNSDNPDKKDVFIILSASVEGRNITRTMSPMGKGLQSWLYAYPSNTTNTIEGEPVGEDNYITSSPGMLTGVQGYKVYLSNDIYSLYAVSCNSSNPAPTFTSGKSGTLPNGVDYLWWHALHQDMTNSQVNIPIIYQHAVTQVAIIITGGENTALNKVLPTAIIPTKPGVFVDLLTGIISSEISYDKPANMGINDFTIQYIMLSSKSSDSMASTMELTVSGESFLRTYNTTTIPPDNILTAGDSHLLRAVINENSVLLGNVSVKDWMDVDESGSPLHPVQD